jgi:anti-sigma factor RsiW
MTEPTSRICREVRVHLPRLVDGSLPAFHEHMVRRHLRRCDECAVEFARQEAVADSLRQIGASVSQTAPEPPEDLLDTIIARAQSPGLRERAAVPARGAVSGERPVLSITFLIAAAMVGTGLGMLLWRAGRTLSSWFGRGPGDTGPSGTSDV